MPRPADCASPSSPPSLSPSAVPDSRRADNTVCLIPMATRSPPHRDAARLPIRGDWDICGILLHRHQSERPNADHFLLRSSSFKKKQQKKWVLWIVSTVTLRGCTDSLTLGQSQRETKTKKKTKDFIKAVWAHRLASFHLSFLVSWGILLSAQMPSLPFPILHWSQSPFCVTPCPQ